MNNADFPVVSHPFLAGIQSNLDDKAVPSPKLIALENCWFERRGLLAKRPGSVQTSQSFSYQDAADVWQAGGLLDSIRTLFASRNELLCVDNDGVPFTWAFTTSRWWQQHSQGNLLAPKITVAPVVKDGTVHTAYDACQTTGWRMTVTQPKSTVAGGLSYQILDSTNGAVVVPPTVFGNANSRWPSCVAVGTALIALYVDTTANQLRAFRVVLSGNVPVTSDVLISGNIRSPYVYDSDTDGAATGTSTFAAIAYSAATTVEAITINSSAAVVNGPIASSGTGGTIEALGVAVDPLADRVGLAWVRNNAGTRTLRAMIRDGGLGAVAAETVVHNAYSTNACFYVTRVFESAPVGGQRVLHILYQDGINGSPVITPLFVRHATFSTAAAIGGPNIYGHSMSIASRAFRDGATMMVTTLPALHSLAFNIKLIITTLGGTTTPATPRPYIRGKYVAQANGPVLSPVAVFNEGGVGAAGPVLTHVQGLGSRRYLSCVGRFVAHIFDAVSFGGGDSFDIIASHAVIDFGVATVQSVSLNDVTYLSGGLLQQNDVGVVESNFIIFPDPVAMVFTSGAGGNLSLGSYTYIVRYEWVNGRGMTEASTFVAKTVTATNSRMTITIPTMPYTARQLQRPISLAVYRTAVNPPANPQFWRVTALDPADTAGSNNYLANDPSVGLMTFIDDRSDTSLMQFDLLDVGLTDLDPINVPHCTCLASDGNRLFVAGLDDPNIVWPSLLVAGFGNGVQFNEALQIRVDDYGGDVNGLAVLNERLIIFKERAIYAITGDGPDNSGANGAFSTPQLIHSDVGLLQPSAVCLSDDGIFFFSTKGWCILDQSLSVKYVGAPVEKYNGLTYSAVTLMPAKRQIRCLSTTGPSLLYDYEIDQWSTFTGNFLGTAAAIYQNSQYVYAQTSGLSFFEDIGGTLFRDGSTEYSMKIRTAWQHGPSQQEYMTGGFFSVLGSYFDFHKLRVTVWYNYDETTPIVMSPDFTPPATQPYQIRRDLPARHEFESVMIQFEDVNDGLGHALGKSFDMVELAVELTQAGGVMRQPPTRSG